MQSIFAGHRLRATALAAVVLLSACGGSSSTGTTGGNNNPGGGGGGNVVATTSVSMVGTAFVPPAISVGSGAVVTSALFTLGKSLIGVYLGNSNVGTAYGAASSLAIVLVWIYWSSAILLLGAEFTQVWTRRYGPGVRPRPGATLIRGT